MNFIPSNWLYTKNNGIRISTKFGKWPIKWCWCHHPSIWFTLGMMAKIAPFDTLEIISSYSGCWFILINSTPTFWPLPKFGPRRNQKKVIKQLRNNWRKPQYIQNTYELERHVVLIHEITGFCKKPFIQQWHTPILKADNYFETWLNYLWNDASASTRSVIGI